MINVVLDEKFVAAMGSSDEPVDRHARQLIALELHREGAISAGKAAELLEMPLLDYIRFSRQRGVPYLEWDQEDWETEKLAIERLAQS